ncbi:MAG: hypothetical protein LAT56_04875 [Wenzhouxiangella sp.]|nr:hypothetical protein [Wenzhouxiangella sp.]
MQIATHGLQLDALPTPGQKASLLGCQTWSNYYQGENDQARAMTFEIDQLTMAVDDPEERLELLVLAASLHFRGGDQVSALEYVYEAQTLAESNELAAHLPLVLGHLAIYLTEAGKFDAAISHLSTLLDLAESAPTASAPIVPIRYNLARALVLGGRSEEAVPHLQWLIEAMQEMGLTSRVASAQSMLARSWREAGGKQASMPGPESCSSRQASYIRSSMIRANWPPCAANRPGWRWPGMNWSRLNILPAKR